MFDVIDIVSMYVKKRTNKTAGYFDYSQEIINCCHCSLKRFHLTSTLAKFSTPLLVRFVNCEFTSKSALTLVLFTGGYHS